MSADARKSSAMAGSRVFTAMCTAMVRLNYRFRFQGFAGILFDTAAYSQRVHTMTLQSVAALYLRGR